MRHIKHVLDQYRAEVKDSGPTLNQYNMTLIGISQAGVCPKSVPCLPTPWMQVDNIIIYLNDVSLSRIIYTLGLLFMPSYIKVHLNLMVIFCSLT